MPDLKLKAGSQAAATILSTELNSLANNAGTALSAAVANQTNLDLQGQCELNVTFAVAPAADSWVELYLVPALDNANDADYVSGTTPAASLNHYAGSFVLRAVTTAQRVTTRAFLLPATRFKLAAINRSGQTFPASGSTVKLTTYIYQSA